MVQIKRAYEAPATTDGKRILVDRLWPRGLTKERARIDLWLKAVAPSTDLRRWFAHDPAKWKVFQSRYRKELARQGEAVDELKRFVRAGKVTLLYAARDEAHNEAAVLLTILQHAAGNGTGRLPTRSTKRKSEVARARRTAKK